MNFARQSFVAFSCLLALGFLQVAAGASPDALTPDGGRYFGPLHDGKLHGQGRIEWDNGNVYEGDFKDGFLAGRGRIRWANGNTYEGEWRNGLMSGRGRFEVPGREIYEGEFRDDFFWGEGEHRHSNGRSYKGSFVRGFYEGQGRFEMPSGDVYEGAFKQGDFVGPGSHSRKDGARYEGEFRDWVYHGAGRYTHGGSVWEGNFVQGQLEGRGKASGPKGAYEGEFKNWRFQGQGVLRLPNGDVYSGGFENGVYEGQGTLTYAKPKPNGRAQESGLWKYGYLDNDGDFKQWRANMETALYAQAPLLDRALKSLRPRREGRVNMYVLAVAGDGSQEVFRREVDFVDKAFASRFDTAGRTVKLINSRHTAASAPMATMTSIDRSLKAIAARMNRAEDILFLFLTSHGSENHELSLTAGVPLRNLLAADLGRMLKESGIRWKVVVVSACYSGGFIDKIRDDHTLVITAARHDRRSFGCADENDFTYFGRAFFKEALPKAKSFQDAFGKAEALVNEWESADASEAAKSGNQDAQGKDDPRSLPQIATTPAVEAHLKRWWRQFR